MGDRRQAWREILSAVLLTLGVVAAFAPASAALESKTATVDSKQIWTNTAVNVRKGQSVAITARGEIHFGLKPIDAVQPAGLPWPRCTTVAGSRLDAWPARGIACWSLIARVDAGPPLAVGAGKTITADRNGTLELGVNDNELSDNSGSWAATIVVVPLRGTGGGSSPMPLILVIAGVALVGLIVFALLRKRRAKPLREEPHGPVIPVYERPATAVSPGDENVNIYEVELSDGELRVGYSYFPEGVVVRWRIAVHGGGDVRGEFAAEGGPAHHEARFSIDNDVVQAARADVTFEWSVGDAHFAYAVTRQVV